MKLVWVSEHMFELFPFIENDMELQAFKRLDENDYFVCKMSDEDLYYINAVSEASDTVQPVLEAIHTGLTRFAQAHASVFQDESAAAAFSGSFSRYHSLLRSQIAAPLRKFSADDFTAEFIAEALLTWTVAGRSIEEISSLVTKLL